MSLSATDETGASGVSALTAAVFAPAAAGAAKSADKRGSRVFTSRPFSIFFRSKLFFTASSITGREFFEIFVLRKILQYVLQDVHIFSSETDRE